MYNRKMSDESGFNAPLTTKEGLEAERVTQSDFATGTEGAPLNATEPAPPAETPPPGGPDEAPPLVAPPETPAPTEPTPLPDLPQQPDAPAPMPNPSAPPQPEELPPIDPSVG